MNHLEQLCSFLGELNEAKISYHLQMVSECNDSILIEIAIPGERWEVEFCIDGHIYVEKFISNGEIYEASELRKLFEHT